MRYIHAILIAMRYLHTIHIVYIHKNIKSIRYMNAMYSYDTDITYLYDIYRCIHTIHIPNKYIYTIYIHTSKH